MKNPGLALLLMTLLSCADNDSPVGQTEAFIEIYETTIPSTATVNQEVEIRLKARASNSCYSSIRIEATEVSSRHFVLNAVARLESSGTCGDIMVYKDTTIRFKPSAHGKYVFQVNEEPFAVHKDTLTVM